MEDDSVVQVDFTLKHFAGPLSQNAYLRCRKCDQKVNGIVLHINWDFFTNEITWHLHYGAFNKVEFPIW